MSELTQEQFDELPDFAKDAFIQDGEKYIPVKNAKLKSTLDELDGKYRAANKQLEEYEAAKLKEIEAAKAEALEEAKKNGKWEEVDKRHEEVLADLNRRHSEQVEALQAQLDELTGNVKREKRGSVVSDIASELATPAGLKAFKRLLQDRVDVDPATGQVTFLDDSGSATSLDLAGFKKELEKDDTFSPLMKSGLVTSGGGNVNGSGAGGAISKPINQMSEAERVEFKQRDPEGFRRALNRK